jgi:hypothetical protein
MSLRIDLQSVSGHQIAFLYASMAREHLPVIKEVRDFHTRVIAVVNLGGLLGGLRGLLLRNLPDREYDPCSGGALRGSDGNGVFSAPDTQLRRCLHKARSAQRFL